MPETIAVAIREVFCAVCQAKPGESCTTPTDTGRRLVTWYHFTRVAAATGVANWKVEEADLVERVFAGLPADGAVISFADLLPATDLLPAIGVNSHDQGRVHAVLEELRSAGRAEVVYGRGWKRRDVPPITVQPVHATSASERYDEAREALIFYDGNPSSISARMRIVGALRALIEPPATVETPEQIAQRVTEEWAGRRDEVILGRRDFEREIAAAVRAGILAAWESWEPENAPGVTE